MSKAEEEKGIALLPNQEPVAKVEHKSIFEALSAFQGENPTIIKNKHFGKEGEKLHFMYADLDSILDIVRPLTSAHGLSFVWQDASTKDETRLQCVLFHESYKATQVRTGFVTTKLPSGDQTEEFFSTVEENVLRSLPVKVRRSGDMKDVGADSTYAKKVTLAELLGITAEEDRDAGEISEKMDAKKTILAIDGLAARIKAADAKILVEHVKFIDKEIARLERGEKKSPNSMDFTLEQYHQLKGIATERGLNLDAMPKPEPSVQVGEGKSK